MDLDGSVRQIVLEVFERVGIQHWGLGRGGFSLEIEAVEVDGKLESDPRDLPSLGDTEEPVQPGGPVCVLLQPLCAGGGHLVEAGWPAHGHQGTVHPPADLPAVELVADLGPAVRPPGDVTLLTRLPHLLSERAEFPASVSEEDEVYNLQWHEDMSGSPEQLEGLDYVFSLLQGDTDPPLEVAVVSNPVLLPVRPDDVEGPDVLAEFLAHVVHPVLGSQVEPLRQQVVVVIDVSDIESDLPQELLPPCGSTDTDDLDVGVAEVVGERNKPESD